MRLLFLSTWFPYPPDNGSKLRVYHLLQALARTHHVTLLSFAFTTAQPEEAGRMHDLWREAQVVTANPFELNRASTLRTFLSTRPMASRPIPAMSQLVNSALNAFSFDAAIASTEMMADYAELAPSTTIRVLEEHNSMTRWARERYEEATSAVLRARCWLSWQKGRHYEARSFPRFDLVTMVSEADRRATLDAAGRRGTRVEVVPNGVDCAHNRFGLAQPGPNSLVFSGSLTYSANYDAMRWFLAEIYPQIRQTIPDVALTITGSTTGVDLAGLPLDPSVRLTGFVDDVRVPVAQAAVCVVPLRQGGGTRLKILEAMALGTPVVATSKGAEGLDVVDGEHLILADEPGTFAARVVTLLKSPERCCALAINARHLVEAQYDWSQIGARFVALVESAVIQARKGHP